MIVASNIHDNCYTQKLESNVYMPAACGNMNSNLKEV